MSDKRSELLGQHGVEPDQCWDLSPDILQLLDNQFSRYDIEHTGALRKEEIRPIGTNIAYLVSSEPFSIQVCQSSSALPADSCVVGT